jgi:hypothetical protein
MVAEREGITLAKYDDVLKLHDDTAVRASKSVKDWKADPSVICVTEQGLPVGWVRIVRRTPKGHALVFFKSPRRANIR